MLKKKENIIGCVHNVGLTEGVYLTPWLSGLLAHINRIQLSGKLLLGLASTVNFGSESRGTHRHVLLSHDSKSPVTESVITRTS
jgi:hypothetical protein